MRRLSITAALLCLTTVLSGCADATSPNATATSDSAITTAAQATSVPVTEVLTPSTDAAYVPSNSRIPAWGECPTSVFPDLSTTDGAGDGYPRPLVVVRCSETQMLVTTNAVPSYTFHQITPNPLEAITWEWQVPLRPEVAAQPKTVVDLLGPIGFTVTGLPIYGPTEGPMPANEAYGDPVYNGILDTCGGHTGFISEYHYHALLDSVAACNLNTSYILGYALDGFPIYNSVGCIDIDCTTTAVFTSGYDMTGNPHSHSWLAYSYHAAGKTNVLDECNGRIGADGTYRYHATSGFPYTFGCLKGLPSEQSGNAAAPMPPMTNP